MRTLSIFGSWWGGNLGDTAILKSTVATMKRQSDTDLEILVHSSNPDVLSKYFTEFDSVSIRKSLNNYWGPSVLQSLSESDAIIIGGGGLFFSNHFFNPQRNHLVNLAPLSVLSKLLRDEVHVFCVGASHLSGFFPGIATRLILKSASSLSARDELSKRTLSRYTGRAVDFVPDPAFALSGTESPRVEEVTAEFSDRTILLSLHDGIARNRSGIDRHDCVSAIIDRVNSFAATDGYDVVLYNNYVFSDWLSEWEDEFDPNVEVHTVETRALQPEEAIAMISECELAVCSQMHVNIFCLLAGTPNVALAYDDKVSAMMDLVDRRSQVLELDESDRVTDAIRRCRPADEERLNELRVKFERYAATIS